MPAALHDALLVSASMREIFSDEAMLAAMLAFEAALAEAEAECGMVPGPQAASIASTCRAGGIDTGRVIAEGARAGALAIPLVRHLTALVAAADAQAAGFVHFGSTSQDVADTALVLQMRRASDLLLADLTSLADDLAALADAHRGTVMLGRTLLQPGPPVTLGLKAANWLLSVRAGSARLERETGAALCLQFGGAVGTLSVLGEAGPSVARALGARLGLPVPPMPWHTRRDGITGIGAALGILAGSLGKVARDLSLMMQFELGEAAEPGGQGRGGSSAMPHKRNPVASMIALGVATRSPGLVAGLLAGMPQEFERALGGWQAEPFALVALFEGVHGSVLAMREAVAGLKVDAGRMSRNIEALQGLIFAERLSSALAPGLGRGGAHEVVEALVQRAIATGSHLRDLALGESGIVDMLGEDGVRGLFDARAALGSVSAFIDAALKG